MDEAVNPVLSLISPSSSHEGMKSCLAFSIEHLHLTLDTTASFYDRDCLLQAAWWMREKTNQLFLIHKVLSKVGALLQLAHSFIQEPSPMCLWVKSCRKVIKASWLSPVLKHRTFQSPNRHAHFWLMVNIWIFNKVIKSLLKKWANVDNWGKNKHKIMIPLKLHICNCHFVNKYWNKSVNYKLNIFWQC